MRPGPCATVLLLLALDISPALTAEEPALQKRTISVTGQGTVKSVPDRATLSFAVETTAARATEAAAENAKRSTAVATAVRPMLDAEDTATTTRYTVEPRYAPRPGETGEPRITGYVARNEVLVETRRIDKVGALVDAATTAGANRVSGVQFSLSRRAESQRAALEQAGADARAQAESVAKGLGVRLKGVASATTVGPIVPTPRFEALGMAAEARATPTPIEPGEISVSATLQVTYEIE